MRAIHKLQTKKKVRLRYCFSPPCYLPTSPEKSPREDPLSQVTVDRGLKKKQSIYGVNLRKRRRYLEQFVLQQAAIINQFQSQISVVFSGNHIQRKK